MAAILNDVNDTSIARARPLQIGRQTLETPFIIAPMAGMTDTAFRRLVKRHGACGLVVTEMVSSEGLVRGIDRTLEFAEYTEEERPCPFRSSAAIPRKWLMPLKLSKGSALTLST